MLILRMKPLRNEVHFPLYLCLLFRQGFHVFKDIIKAFFSVFIILFLSTKLDFDKRHKEGMLILHGWLKLRNKRISTSVVNGPQRTQ